MLGFDPRSFIVISTCLAALCAFLCYVMRRGIPPEIKGLTCWGNACVAMVLSSILFALRSSVHVLYSSYLANIAIISSTVMMYCSVRQFCNRTSRIAFYLAVPLIAAAILILPTFVYDNYRLRVITVATIDALMFFLSADVLRRSGGKRFPEYFTMIVFSATGLISTARSLAAITMSTTVMPLTDLSYVQYVYLATFAFSLVALSLGFFLMVGKQLQIKLEGVALYDGLTSILTRSAFNEIAGKALSRASRAGRVSSMLMIDLDDFKAINDLHGHSGGDRVLQEFVRRTSAVLRNHDLFARYGGEEFAVLLPDTPEGTAAQVASRICDAVRENAQSDIASFTVSIGLATSTAHVDGVHQLLDQADEALYQAKEAGKNRVKVYDPLVFLPNVSSAPPVS